MLKVMAGLIVFLVLVTFPFWYDVGESAAAPEAELDTPAIQQLPEKKCVEATPYMREAHMALLNTWRTAVVRDGYRVYVAADGKSYDMSLQNKCLECHENKSEFCDRCHDYLGVAPDCWNCHVEPEEE